MNNDGYPLDSERLLPEPSFEELVGVVVLGELGFLNQALVLRKLDATEDLSLEDVTLLRISNRTQLWSHVVTHEALLRRIHDVVILLDVAVVAVAQDNDGPGRLLGLGFRGLGWRGVDKPATGSGTVFLSSAEREAPHLSGGTRGADKEDSAAVLPRPVDSAPPLVWRLANTLSRTLERPSFRPNDTQISLGTMVHRRELISSEWENPPRSASWS